MRIIAISCLLACVTALAADPVTYRCTYATFASEDGLDKEDGFVLTFIVDSDAGKSYMLGNLGSVEVIAVPGEGKLTFIEVTDTNNVMVTTIVGGGQSVHSRHPVYAGEIISSQYYGSCQVQ